MHSSSILRGSRVIGKTAIIKKKPWGLFMTLGWKTFALNEYLTTYRANGYHQLLLQLVVGFSNVSLVSGNWNAALLWWNPGYLFGHWITSHLFALRRSWLVFMFWVIIHRPFYVPPLSVCIIWHNQSQKLRLIHLRIHTCTSISCHIFD